MEGDNIQQYEGICEVAGMEKSEQGRWVGSAYGEALNLTWVVGGGPSGRATTEHMYEEHERMRHTDSR